MADNKLNKKRKKVDNPQGKCNKAMYKCNGCGIPTYNCSTCFKVDVKDYYISVQVVSGKIIIYLSLIFNMFGGDGLFNKKLFKQYIVWHVKDILDTNAWFDIDVVKPLNDRKRKEYIKKKLVDDKKIESIASIYMTTNSTD
eukprot:430746_1